MKPFKGTSETRHFSSLDLWKNNPLPGVTQSRVLWTRIFTFSYASSQNKFSAVGG